MALDAGTLTRRFELQSPTRAQNAFGETTITWSHEAFRWGSIQAARSRERINAAQVSTEVTHEVVMRNRGLDLKADWRLVLGTRSFQVVEVFDPNDGHDQFTLEVAEVLSL